MGRFNSRRQKCVNQDAAANVEAEAENQEAERHEDENQEAERREDGSPSTYLNLPQDADVIASFLFFQLSKLYISVDLNIVHIFKWAAWRGWQASIRTKMGVKDLIQCCLYFYVFTFVLFISIFIEKY